MKRHCLNLGGLAIIGVALLLVGCAKKSGVQNGELGATEGKMGEETITKPSLIQEAPVTPGAGVRTGGGPGTEGPLKDVFFDFDKAILTDEAKKTLDADIKWLKANPATRIAVEGHSDERGTDEYNLGLGEHRAKAVRDYLVAGGIDAKRITTISYGEERPFVLGHDESAWKWNRRAHFVIAPR
ncbi:MAG: peptidoglycan-associated lipoprotein Pal [candidate division NC10 bacterium]|nr:peptidoglycan-associated lipoprotein Pal [candidate division NC10 bacterium]